MLASETSYHLQYDNNTGIAYFDNLCLVSDMTSSSYTYDANGNLLSATNNSGRWSRLSLSQEQEFMQMFGDYINCK